MKEFLKQKKGITLIALIITIIILIILAGVSINVLFGSEGIVTKAKNAKENYKIAQLDEGLQLVKSTVQMDEEKLDITVEEYLNKLQEPGIIKFSLDKVEIVSENVAYITVDKEYKFLVEHKENGTLIIVYQGKADAVEIPEGEITFTDAIWNNEKASITINTTSDFKIAYQKNTTSGEWTEIANGGTISDLNNGDVIYAKLVNAAGQSSENYAEYRVKDALKPNSATIELTGEETQSSLPVTLNAKVTHIDEQSGVDISLCGYEINNSSDELGTNKSSYTGTFSSKEQNIEIKPANIGTWYLHVLTVDKAGNKKETIKGPIEITETTHVHTGNSSSGGGCYGKANYKTEQYNIVCGKTGSVTAWNTWTCTAGHTTYNNVEGGYNTWPAPSNCNVVTGTGTRQVLTGYSLNCGKTEDKCYSVKY